MESTAKGFRPGTSVLLCGAMSFNLIVGINLLRKVEVGALLPEKALAIGAQYRTVCTNSIYGRQVGILESATGLRTYELLEEPPFLFWPTGDPKNPYREGLNITPEEFSKRLKDILKSVKEEQLQKSKKDQNGD